MAASVFGVCGNAFAQANDFCEDEFHLEEGQHYTDNGNNVYFENAAVTVDGTYESAECTN